MARTLRLGALLGGLLRAPKPPRAPDHDRKYRDRFKRLVAQRGASWIKTRDGYVEVTPFDGYPLGVTICHHSWDETLERFEEALGDPTTLDAEGYHTV